MPAEQTRAIVLRLVEFSETSVIATLFTEDFGKVGALAKGARRPKGPFEGALDLLALARIVLLRKSSDSLDLLTEAKLERRFRSSQRDLARLYAGYYIAELLSELTEPGDPHPALFQAADRALMTIDTNASLTETIVGFELFALREVGHLPSLDHCVVCGKPIARSRSEPTARVAFGMTAGGVLCDECRPGRRGVVSVSNEVLEALREAAGLADDTDGEDATAGLPSSGLTTSPEVPAAIRGELRAVLNNYFAHLVGHRLRMTEYLGVPHK